MSDTRAIHKSIKQLQVIKTWQLVVLLVLMLFVSATFLRLNNTGMIERRNAVAHADETADEQEISSRIYDLQRYSAAHMNADTGVFYLQKTYDRNVQDVIAQNSRVSERNKSLNAKAEAVCRPQFSGYSTGYLQCFLAELEKQKGADTLPTVSPPNPALYRYSFISPVWSPDFAGFSVLITLVLMGVIVLRIIVLVILKLLLHHRFRQV